MNRLSRHGMVLTIVVLLGAGVAGAQITPVGVTASSTFQTTYDPIHLIDDSGLSGGVHDNTWQNMWTADDGDISPWLVFDLGDVFDLTAADIWQYLYASGLSRGVQTFDILVSLDGVTFTAAGSGSLTQGSGATTPMQTAAFTATGRYVRFEVTSNFGSTFSSGLSEVKFEGVVVPVELQSFSIE